MLTVVVIAFVELGIVLAELATLALVVLSVRRFRRGRHAGRAGGFGRHAAPSPVDHESYAEPELNEWQRTALTGVVSWAELDASPAAIANGRELANKIRCDELANDLAAGVVLLHVIELCWEVQELLEQDPLEGSKVVGEAITGAAYELTELHRARI